jgi:LPS-assembly lipoprotein
MRNIAITLIIGLAVALQACGFHLRGHVALPPAFDATYVKSTDAALQNQIEEVLRVSGTRPAHSAAGATAILNITDVRYEPVVRTVDARGKVSGYLLTYTVSYGAVDAAGKTLLKDQRLELQRDYNFDPEQVLAKESEESFLRRDMEKDAAQQIVRQLGAIGK